MGETFALMIICQGKLTIMNNKNKGVPKEFKYLSVFTLALTFLPFFSEQICSLTNSVLANIFLIVSHDLGGHGIYNSGLKLYIHSGISKCSPITMQQLL